MKLDKRQVRTLLLVGIIVGSVFGPAIVGAVASYLGNSASVSNGVTFAAPNGPSVKMTESADVNMTNLFPDANTVEIRSSAGNVTLSSTGATNATVTNINGTWTNVSAIDAGSTTLEIDPDDKQKVSVSGNIDTLDFRSVKVDDGTIDFVYGGVSGTSTVTVTGLKPNTDYRAVDADTGESLAGGESDGSGTVTFSGMDNPEHKVLVKTSEGGPGLSDPRPEGPQSDFPTTLGVTVSDPDFDDGENVTVEFYLDGSKVGENSTTSEGEVTTSIAKPARGSHDVKAVATDSQGNTKTLTWTFSVPNELEVREVKDPFPLVDDRQVNFTFYENDEIFRRSVTDGNVSLEGIPVDEDIVVGVEADGFHTAFFVIEDITKQQTVYLLNSSEASVEVRFTLRDRVGNFEGNEPTLYIQKPINRTGTIQWHSVYADQFGTQGVTADLEEGQRYRLVIKNADNDVRVLGTYTADVSETVQLTVGSVSSLPEGCDCEFTHNASYKNDSASSSNYVSFEYNDTVNLTSSLTVKIYERGNESNVLFANQTFSGPLGTVAITEPVPSDQEGLSWVVEVTGQRDGEQIKIRVIVGPRSPVIPELPGWLKAIISIGSIWIVAGVFSQLNGDVGALATAGLGGMWWYVDFLPQETGVGVVVLSLLTAGAMLINNRRGSSI